jgi:signal transduction histidine kinase
MSKILQVSLLQHAVSSSFGLKTRLPFILEQLSCRTAMFRDELMSKSNHLLPLNAPLQTKLNALGEAGSHDPQRISSTYEAISTEILTYIGLHKDLVMRMRLSLSGRHEGDESAEERLLRISLCRVHMLATSMRLFASSAAAAVDPDNSTLTRNALQVNRSLHIPSLIKSSTDEVRAFCVEKFGAAPGVHISVIGTNSSMSVVGVKELIAFAYVELLKNAMTAMIARYMAAGVDDAPEINVQITCNDSHYLYVSLTDSAGGLEESQTQTIRQLYLNRPFRLFSSVATAARQEIDYKYSREFGVPFSGSGLGLLRSDLFCKLHGGYVSLYPSTGGSATLAGTSARIVIDRSGSTTDMEALESII